MINDNIKEKDDKKGSNYLEERKILEEGFIILLLLILFSFILCSRSSYVHLM
jgi:hypothetical protein